MAFRGARVDSANARVRQRRAAGAHAARGRTTSAVKRADPTFSTPFQRGADLPIWARSALAASGGALPAGTYARLASATRRRSRPPALRAAMSLAVALPSAPPCLGGGEHGFDHMRIRAAAAKVAANDGLDLRFSRIRIAIKQSDAAEHQARRAEAALDCVVSDESRLNRMQRPVAGDAFDGRDRAVANLDGQDRARCRRRAVDENCAGRTGARSQPIFVPVRPSGPRNTSATVARGSATTVRVTH